MLGLILRYRPAGSSGDWIDLPARGPHWDASPEKGTAVYASGGAPTPLKVTETYRTDGRVLDWTIDLEAAGPGAVEVGDLGISIPTVGPTGEDPAQIFERGFLRHQFISGHGSFFYYIRASGAPPFLLVTVRPGTKLEYSAGGGRGGIQAFVHSARTGGSRNARHVAPGPYLARARTGRPAGKPGFVRIPDAMGRKL